MMLAPWHFVVLLLFSTVNVHSQKCGFPECKHGRPTSHVQPCAALYGHMQPCAALYGHVQPCAAMYGKEEQRAVIQISLTVRCVRGWNLSDAVSMINWWFQRSGWPCLEMHCHATTEVSSTIDFSVWSELLDLDWWPAKDCILRCWS